MGDGAVVLGTDLSAVSLDKARTASYSDYSMRDVGLGFLESYFHHVRGRRLLVERIRSKVRFEHLNLVGAEDYASAGAVAMDVVLCRNVLIYFGREKVGRIAARLYDCLAEGGVLLTAGADPILAEYAPFEVEITRVGLVYRRPRLARTEAAAPRLARAAPPPLWSPDHARRTADHEEPAPPIAATPSPPELAREAFMRMIGYANASGAEEAEQIAQVALRRHPLDAPLHYLRAALLLSLGRDEEAEHEAQRAVYLDRSLAVGHFLLGTILRKRGARPLAQRSFRNVRDLCSGRPPDEEVPAGAGEKAGALHFAAAAEMARLEQTGD
jgi:chemotaxis protein methyltransferase CheR